MSDGTVESTQMGQVTLPEEELLRARHYRFLARWLARPADQALLDLTGSLEGDASEFGMAVNALAAVARTTTPAMAEEEYFALFIGLGRGELVPYGSYYLTGFLNEKPVATLISDMRRLGVARAQGVPESEDHIAALCDTMACLIEGRFGAMSANREAGSAATAEGPLPNSFGPQSAMFTKHVLPWAGQFFKDLEAAKSARLYRPIGTLGRLFVEIEETAFQMAA